MIRNDRNQIASPQGLPQGYDNFQCSEAAKGRDLAVTGTILFRSEPGFWITNPEQRDRGYTLHGALELIIS